MKNVGATLKGKIAGIPVWTLTLLFIIMLAWYLRRRKNQQMAAQAQANSQGLSTNLGVTPVSNLTTDAQPMPIQMGDTFVDVQPANITVDNTPGGSSTPPAPTATPPAAPPAPPSNAPPPSVPPGPTQPPPYVQPVRARPGCSAMPWGGIGACAPTPPAGTLAPPKPSVAPSAPPAPSAPRTVTVCSWPSWCGSLSGIAAHFYGNASEWPTIYNANRGKIGSNPNLIRPGQVLVVP